jgi:asparagine N-glycosylation enzyme membrane subunit Stt3
VTRVAVALALAAAALGLRFGTFAASGADSYGYVSQADLWLDGRLIIDEPLADQAEWRNANWTLTPFGYRPGDDRGTMVPTYAPGLPMVMALFKAVGGGDAAFYAVPLLGALAVWLTFVLGRRLGGPQAGVLAAAALLVSPTFLFQLMWPMSDVPAMAWWLAAMVLTITGTPALLAAGGLAAAMATLTRPNLVVLVIPMLAFVASRPGTAGDRIRRALLFALAAAPGPIAVATINQHLYGSTLASGYGTFATIYAGRHLLPNLVNYTTWLLQTQTPFIALAAAAPWLLGRRGDRSARPIVVFSVGMTAAVVFSYLWYQPFDHWTFLRFLLPSYPPLLALAAAAFTLLAPRARAGRLAAFAALIVVLAGWGFWTGRAAFQVRTEESRYVSAGRFARDLPPDAVILCNQHSGSLRYYANRITMRFEWLDPDMYVEALDQMRRLGRPVYVVLDDWERDVFRQRYGGVADLSWLDEPPLVVAARRVYFYTVVPSTARRDTGL